MGLDDVWWKTVDGHEVRYRVVIGEPSWLEKLSSSLTPGPWGQLASATSGSVSRKWGAQTTVNLSGGNVCNTVMSPSGSVNAGEIQVSVIIRRSGTYEVLWNWEISASGNAQSGVAIITAPNGVASLRSNFGPFLLNPGFHDGGVERTCVRIKRNDGFFENDPSPLIAVYSPTLSRTASTGSDGKQANSTAIGRITVLQIKRVGD
jgi:hypothetical protein